MAESKIFTRRDLLKTAGAIGAAAVSPAIGEAASTDPHPSTNARDALSKVEGHLAHPAATGDLQAQTAGVDRGVPENLTAAEADTLDAMCARIIPSDALGPGAREARAMRYIDRALGGALAGSKDAYRAGLASLDRYARAARGKAFYELSPTDQDSVLIDVEAGSATPGMFAGSSATFFTMVRSHTMQGTFGDPFYGGNANFVGWDLINYPGVRTQVTVADQQQLERDQLKPNHRSAYDTAMFNKATVKLEPSDRRSEEDLNKVEA